MSSRSSDAAKSQELEFAMELGDRIIDYIEARTEFRQSLESRSSDWQDSAHRQLEGAAYRLLDGLRKASHA